METTFVVSCLLFHSVASLPARPGYVQTRGMGPSGRYRGGHWGYSWANRYRSSAMPPRREEKAPPLTDATRRMGFYQPPTVSRRWGHNQNRSSDSRRVWILIQPFIVKQTVTVPPTYAPLQEELSGSAMTSGLIATATATTEASASTSSPPGLMETTLPTMETTRTSMSSAQITEAIPTKPFTISWTEITEETTDKPTTTISAITSSPTTPVSMVEVEGGSGEKWEALVSLESSVRSRAGGSCRALYHGALGCFDRFLNLYDLTDWRLTRDVSHCLDSTRLFQLMRSPGPNPNLSPDWLADRARAEQGRRRRLRVQLAEAIDFARVNDLEEEDALKVIAALALKSSIAKTVFEQLLPEQIYQGIEFSLLDHNPVQMVEAIEQEKMNAKFKWIDLASCQSAFAVQFECRSGVRECKGPSDLDLLGTFDSFSLVGRPLLPLLAMIRRGQPIPESEEWTEVLVFLRLLCRAGTEFRLSEAEAMGLAFLRLRIGSDCHLQAS